MISTLRGIFRRKDPVYWAFNQLSKALLKLRDQGVISERQLNLLMLQLIDTEDKQMIKTIKEFVPTMIMSALIIEVAQVIGLKFKVSRWTRFKWKVRKVRYWFGRQIHKIADWLLEVEE